MQTYRGSCHCGAVRIEFDGEVQGAEVCNCSICARTGYLHWYTAPEHFRLVRGEDALSDYRFGTRVAHNLFCNTCGVSPFRRARSDPDKIDVNLRCVEGIDLDALRIERFDGANWEEAMQESRGRGVSTQRGPSPGAARLAPVAAVRPAHSPKPGIRRGRSDSGM